MDFDHKAAIAHKERERTAPIAIKTSGIFKFIPEGVSATKNGLVKVKRRNYNPRYGGVHPRYLCDGFKGQ